MMRSVKAFSLGAMFLALLLLGVGPAQAQRKTPYWASISAGKARMRTGPGRQFPINWLFVRADLPIKVIASIPNWRKIEDPSGTQGWMQSNLLSERRTAIVVGEIRPLRSAPDAGARVSWRVAPGVVGRISRCANGWCYLDVRGRGGFVEEAHIWGLDAGETVP